MQASDTGDTKSESNRFAGGDHIATLRRRWRLTRSSASLLTHLTPIIVRDYGAWLEPTCARRQTRKSSHSISTLRHMHPMIILVPDRYVIRCGTVQVSKLVLQPTITMILLYAQTCSLASNAARRSWRQHRAQGTTHVHPAGTSTNHPNGQNAPMKQRHRENRTS